jgi:DNA-binding response OmpR family regulator
MVRGQRKPVVVVADGSVNVLNLLSDVLRNAGLDRIHYALTGRELIAVTREFEPDLVLTTSRLPEISGLEFTRMVRAGVSGIPRDLAIVAMTDTATRIFLEAAQNSGVDEMLVRPFSAQAVVQRALAALRRKRPFIDSTRYVGPCRRRRPGDDYHGPMRRFVDPIDDESDGGALWEKETHRQAVRNCVQRISECARHLTSGDRRKLREIFAVVKEAESMADEARDEMMGAAARSLGRYIVAVGSNGHLDAETIKTHIDAMHTLGVLTSAHHEERQRLVEGLIRVVDKKLGRRRDERAYLLPAP